MQAPAQRGVLHPCLADFCAQLGEGLRQNERLPIKRASFHRPEQATLCHPAEEPGCGGAGKACPDQRRIT